MRTDNVTDVFPLLLIGAVCLFVGCSRLCEKARVCNKFLIIYERIKREWISFGRQSCRAETD